jgi:hypothetical protein
MAMLQHHLSKRLTAYEYIESDLLEGNGKAF